MYEKYNEHLYSLMQFNIDNLQPQKKGFPDRFHINVFTCTKAHDIINPQPNA